MESVIYIENSSKEKQFQIDFDIYWDNLKRENFILHLSILVYLPCY